MELEWLTAETVDDGDVDGAVGVQSAVRDCYAPHWLCPTPADFRAGITVGWDGDPSRAAVVRDKRGRVLGLLEVTLPHWDNTHLGFIEVTVDPSARRQGVGRQLFEAGVEQVRAAGRTLLVTDSFDEPGCVAFAEAMGLEKASTEAQRRQDLVSLPWDALDKQYAAAEQQAADYELMRVQGATPDHLIDRLATLFEAINDAPLDDLQVEDEVFSPERIRAMERGQRHFNRRPYRVVAVHKPTGQLAGHTAVGVVAHNPWAAYQYDTSVLRGHRGHRLGTLLKLDMLRWLADAEPQLRTLDTWNAASNSHMVDVNELLGYQVVLTAFAWQKQV